MNDEAPLQPEQGSHAAGRAPLIFVLLLLQAAIGLLETLVTLTLAGAAPLGAGLGVLSAALTVSLAAVAAGVVCGRRWARIGATAFEALVLGGAALRLLVRHGALPGLVWLLSDVALPIAVIDLLWIHLSPVARPLEGAVLRDSASRRMPAAGGSRPAPQA
ncbi:MAG TPA: hypothetical protein VFD32_14960 [Dehalococcoidia bacterium]|nr:hypothetical protein [Dehalococcoidia bacterium]